MSLLKYLKEDLKILLEQNHFMKIGWQIWYKLSQKKLYFKKSCENLVNPIDYGTDVVFESDYFHQVEKIVEDDSDGLWITQGPIKVHDLFICCGAKTINSANTYPDLDKWHKIDSNNTFKDVYNRSAHIDVDINKDNATYFELLNEDQFCLHLNINDMEKLNISYIATNNNLDDFSNDNIKFEKLYKENDYRIYKVTYI